MSEPVADTAALFDDDYLYFFEERLEEVSDADTDRIWKVLDLAPGMEVLDLGCGHGRITNRLAERGCRVTGLDLSTTFLKRARETAAARGVTVDYLHEDMRNMTWSGRFDRIVNFGNAFGFFDDADDQRVLARVAQALRPGGRFLLETINYPRYLRDWQPSSVEEHHGDLVADVHRLDPLTNRSIATRTTIRDGRIRREPSSHRLHTYTELRDWLRGAGFTSIDGFGEDGAPLTAEHRRAMVVAGR
ncbi:class I SAM-dependent methyltransferase [Micromonospora sp. PLK6-60]|uniref:SAM-dependent methyltransferase n=1 Tax=Micromonospora sp. PLK6-60 TaxID=2873383 RepID=UPI001CA7AFFE|nr:class I SAM-dependent methyltransferase [Micromonospora sp. PLK6-60]MBY8870728.1 class I SAM-dependent methyltransferase [Micromonospora sp. PLK6-60]